MNGGCLPQKLLHRPAGSIRRTRSPEGSVLSSTAKEAGVRAKMINSVGHKQAFCMVQLSWMHSEPASAPSMPQEGWRSESRKGWSRAMLGIYIGNRQLSPHLQQQVFLSVTVVRNFRLGRNGTIAFHCSQQACTFLRDF